MRVTLALAALLLAGALAGCTGGGGDKAPTVAAPAEPTALAPWWQVGEGWTIAFEREGQRDRVTTLVMFANNTFGDPPHFWLGVPDRDEAMSHVFFDDNIFLGRIHWEYLAPHERGRHSDMYSWPLTDGKVFDAHAFDRDWSNVVATARADGGFDIEGDSDLGARISYDYDPETRWFSRLEVVDEDGNVELTAGVTGHATGNHGTFYFLRGRDFLDADGGTTGQEEPFEVGEKVASIAFLLDVTAGPGSRVEFLAPDGTVFHSENLLTGGTSDKIVEIPREPPQGAWKLRYIGSVTGEIKVRGILEYKATI